MNVTEEQAKLAPRNVFWVYFYKANGIMCKTIFGSLYKLSQPYKLTKTKWIIVWVIMILISGCSQVSAPSVIEPTANGSESGYPSVQESYPGPASEGVQSTVQGSVSAYPAPNASIKQGPEFKINAPVRSTDKQISGTGPANVPIKLLNITQSGATIAESKIGDDGSFTIDVSGGFIAGDRIAVSLGNTQGTDINPNDFISGPGYQDFPFIGVIFDSVLVE